MATCCGGGGEFAPDPVTSRTYGPGTPTK